VNLNYVLREKAGIRWRLKGEREAIVMDKVAVAIGCEDIDLARHPSI
jgi:hypothetical protein